MKGKHLVEMIVAIYSFAYCLIQQLLQQFIFQRLWLEETNTTYPVIDISGCTKNSSNLSRQYEEVERAASLFFMYNELCAIIPSFFTVVLLVAYTDQRGRKFAIIPPLVGSTIYALFCLAVSFFQLSLKLLMVGNFVNALFGGWVALLGGCYSYVADVCQDSRQRTWRMAGVELATSFSCSIAFIVNGYMLRATGFNWPFFAASLLFLAGLLYGVFFLEETVMLPNAQGGLQAPLLKLANGIRQVFVSANRRRNCVLVLLVLTFVIVCDCNMSMSDVVTLYELNEPLCWSEILIGYSSALTTGSGLISFVGVFLLSHCLPDLVIILIGLLSIMTGMAMRAFAKTTQLMFLASVPMVLAMLPPPVLRSMMSEITSKSQQGALFACVACLETLNLSASTIGFSSLYSATVSWFPGFCFLLAAGLCLIGMALMGAVGALGSNEATETEDLVSAEEMDS